MHIGAAGLVLAEYRGGLALLGPALESVFDKFWHAPRPAAPLHITLLSAAERKAASLGPRRGGAGARAGTEALPVPLPLPSIPVDNIYALGTGHKKDVAWVVAVWNHGDVYRRSLGLGKKDYHMTLTDADDHTADKGVAHVALSPGVVVELVAGMGEGALDHVFVASVDEVFKRLLAERMVRTHPDSYKGFARLASVSPTDPKAAILSYARAAALNPALLPVAAAQIRSLRSAASYGAVLTAAELERMPPPLVAPWPSELDPLVSVLWTHTTTSRERQVFNNYALPRFFSWVYPGRIAGMSTPRRAANIDALESPLPPAWCRFRVQHTSVPVPNYGAPTLAEMDEIYARVGQGGTWLVHCGGGVGRAGTVLACLVAMLGRDGEAADSGAPLLAARTAITLLRDVRPRSLETEEQERFVSAWVSHRWRTVSHSPIPEPVGALVIQGEVRDVSAVLLIGRPGSGKSHLARALQRRRPVLVVSQDESESRTFCETAISPARADTLVILDRCNPRIDDRRAWLGLLDRPCVAVYLDYARDLCRQRMDHRLAHPTIRAGRGAGALEQMHREMQPPALAEGFVGIMTIASHAAAAEAVERLAPLCVLKFPRTPHLLDLGAATDDDIVHLQHRDITGTLTIEEKIDGANVGISLSRGQLPVQNRSHWLAAEGQFARLPHWLARHAAALRRILSDSDSDAGADADSAGRCDGDSRWILYGEWVVARHSIAYTALPGEFIAFDLYDRTRARFLSRSGVACALANSGIPHVPLVRECTAVSRDEVLAFLQQPSVYGAPRVEGV